MLDLGSWLVLISSAFLGLYSYIKWKTNYWKRKGIVYESAFESLKQIFTREKQYYIKFYDLYRKYSEFSFIGLFYFNSPVILIRDPELIKVVLAKNFNHFHDNDIPFNDPIFGRNPFVLTGERWKITRGRLTPGFTNIKIKNNYDNMLRVTDELKEYLLKHPENLDAKEISAKFTTEVVAKSIFGIDGNTFVNEDAEFRSMGVNIMSDNFLLNIAFIVNEIIPFMKFFKTRLFSKKVITFFENLVKESLEFRKKNQIDRNDFFSHLMQLHAKHPDFDMVEVISHSILFFTDGFETSSTALAMCLYELAKNPQVQEKARAEVDAAYQKHGNLTFEAITESLPYVENCIQESMRIYPPITYLQRLCTQQIDLTNDQGKSVTIDAGTRTIIPILALHHDEKYFPEPMAYRPERFSPEEAKDRHKYVYLPFSEGPRICLGIKFALVQTKLGLAYILRNFNIVPNEKTPKNIHLSKAPFLAIYTVDQAPYVTFQERKNIPAQ